MTAFADMERLSPALLRNEWRGRITYWWHCPGCDEPHGFDDRWTFNGDNAKPTFNPSFLTWNDPNPAATREPWISGSRCHSFVRDGQIQFLSDCTHALAGKTVPLPEFPL